MARWIRVCAILLGSGLLCTWAALHAQQSAPRIVYVVPIDGIIDLGLAPFVQRVLDEATAANAAAVVLDINTLGGRVDGAVQIRDALLNSRVRTVAFVDKRAISAGALIALAAEKIAMADGGTIGAAAPVLAGAPGAAAQPVGEKTVSYVRKEFRATAEARKRPPLLAEAMVDADVKVPGVIDKGKLLTLTTNEALKLKVADFRANTLDEVLEQLGIEGAEIRRPAHNWAEHFVRFLTHPMVSSLLITVALLGIVIELRTPGFGVPGALGIASLALFLWGHWLVQLVGWEELLLVVVGIALLALELLVIPGFGITGVLGILAILGALALGMVGSGATAQVIMEAAMRVVFAVLLALVGSLVLLRFLPQLPFGRRLILRTGLDAARGYASTPASDLQWLGRRGRAWSPLRPAGIADIDGQRVDVVSDGELVEAGAPIEVIRVDGNRIVVRRAGEVRREEVTT
ncbi:MAG: nodulation protein NfeD [Burkholderiales bacterium]|nr:nodulation protein NfeD [Burkholderiales bacterium]